ncbi:flippase [Marinobacter flavimaris]|uniref:Flippase n=1 Tax=Marinobacter flavimaris TaxID=262076 RepID=A0A3D8H6N2_9GAMM|nr:flippase [Marinobacter flavimaris]PPI81933.1 flippase [Marinobacter flavimaris]RDU42384.1 flippase [Marinobacter flavimaris]
MLDKLDGKSVAQIHQLIRNGLRVIGVRVAGTGLAFALAIVLARSLGAEGYGLYSFVLSLLFFLSIPIQAGLPNLVVRETAKARLHYDWPTIKGLWYWVVGVILVASSIFIICVLLIEQMGTDWISKERLDLMIVGLLFIPFIGLTINHSAIIRGLGHVVLGIVPDAIVRPALTLLLVGSVFVFGSPLAVTPGLAMFSYVFSIGTAFALSSILLYLVIPREQRRFGPSRMDIGYWKRSAYPLTVVGGLQIMYSYSDLLILGMFHSDTEVGIYRAVGQLGMLVVFGLSAINQMLHPQISKLFSSGRLVDLQKMITMSSLGIFILALIPGVPLIVFGGDFLEFIFGHEFSDGAVALVVLTFGQLVNAAFGSVGALLNMTGHETDAMKGMFVSLGVNITFAFILIPPFGIEGAALATAVSLATWNIILRHFVKKRLGIESIGILNILKRERIEP